MTCIATASIPEALPVWSRRNEGLCHWAAEVAGLGDYTWYPSIKVEPPMHKKVRGKTAYLYRSSWVPKGASGNTHGYSVQTYVGSLAVDSTSLPKDLEALLTDDERLYVETVVCRPAREAADQARKASEQREVDPLWRLTEAARLVGDAAECSQRRRVPRQRVQEVSDALGRVQLLEPAEVKTPPQEKRPDPLLEALGAVRAAAAAVRAGSYGRAPETGVRSSRPYRLWSDIYEAVCGTDGETSNGSLMRALQDRGFAKSRQR